MKRAALALAALVASTVALAQQTTQQAQAQRQASSSAQRQRAPRMSETDKLTLITDCTRQVQAAHPSVPEKEVKTYCEERLKSYLYLSQR